MENIFDYNIVFSILGILGGILTGIGDILFDLKGNDNEEIGDLKMICSNWVKMPTWRFASSILLVTVGVPFYILGGISLSNQIGLNSEFLSNTFLISIILGGIGGYFIHTLVCIIPVIYKHLIDTVEFEIINSMVNKIWDLVKIPFILFYINIILFTSIIVIISICKGYLNVPNWFVLLNPLVFLIIGIFLRKINPKLFYEIPSIFMGSLGLSMFGVVGLVSILGG